MEEFTVSIDAQGLKLVMEFTPGDSDEWMECRVEVQVPSFAGQYACNICVPELKNLQEQLEALRSHVGEEFTAAWENMERNIRLELRLDDRGRLHGRYRFSPDVEPDVPVLSGSFHADSEALRNWLSQVRSVIRYLT